MSNGADKSVVGSAGSPKVKLTVDPVCAVTSGSATVCSGITLTAHPLTFWSKVIV